jgi:hypothetical protein
MTPESPQNIFNDSIAAPAGDPNDKPTVLETIQKLRDQSITGKALTVQARRACVEYLITEGSSIPEIAKVLDVSEKTITRDRKAIQEAYALEPDPKLVPQIVGRLLHEAELCMSRVRRAAREKEATPDTRVAAARACFQTWVEFIQNLQRLGYAPTATQRIEANLKHELHDLPKVDDLMLEVDRLRTVAIQNDDGQTAQQLTELLRLTAHVNLADQVNQIKSLPSNGGNHAAST